MHKDVQIKRIKLLVFGLTLALAGWQIAGKGASARGAEQNAGDRPEFAGVGAPMAERLGADDKPALVVHFSGDIHGGLEPCG